MAADACKFPYFPLFESREKFPCILLFNNLLPTYRNKLGQSLKRCKAALSVSFVNNNTICPLLLTLGRMMSVPVLSFPLISVTGSFGLPKLKKEKEETWLDKQLKEVTNGSVAKEMAIGGISGWCAGIVFSKVGKTAASALAGSLLMFQIAQHQGYIKVNWSKVNRDIEKAKGKLDKHSKSEIHWFVEETKSFIKEYKFLVTGFAGGFLIGIAMC